jgi:hypothetical protein
MDPSWAQSADQVASGLASLYVESNGAGQSHKLAHQGNGWMGGPPATRDPTPPSTPQSMISGGASPNAHQVGWGGQVSTAAAAKERPVLAAN